MNSVQYILGIESTAHTFGCGIASSEGKILSNVKSEYVPASGGIHPREASQHHAAKAAATISGALKEAGLRLNDIAAVAFSAGPGLGPCLRTGATVARTLSLVRKCPLVPVNHCIAHIEIGRLVTCEDDPLVVYVSGGNTIISAYAGGRYRVFGETLDIALGNCLDTFARHLGLPHPGVPKLEQLADGGKKFIPLPYVVKGQDVSYSGLLTMASRLASKCDMGDLSLSLLEVAYGMVAEVAERAIAHTEKGALLLTGGVARSKRLQRALSFVCSDHSARFHVVPPDLAGDNGGMIAWTGYLALKEGLTVPVESSYVNPNWRLDEVEVPWRR
ncbi:MAG: KEOPS complex N(6)-L-threonylcarbamoyladenine synthase Kae1 [Candidatus Methanosuratincola verstraetei]|jgi:N6-L-threonylcarbamoyladenine synthase|uniref:tRNA N6-adenosine threonylcarbamoyltransferase n=2 Tax=Candidatus Methanosuratincola (ex Vanwonterghem et al. 2016) TaxID=1915412 RepID=A0A7J3UXL5_9CREN|nr:MAG: N(6)-L-threonylcarbamoyladenine synthase [Candidatus Methanosuratincola subterraneus]